MFQVPFLLFSKPQSSVRRLTTLTGLTRAGAREVGSDVPGSGWGHTILERAGGVARTIRADPPHRRTMRILAAADLHGNHEVWEWLVRTAAAEHPDVVVLAGDLLGTPDDYASVLDAQRADRARVLAHLAQLQQPVFYVMGNDDLIELLPDSVDQTSVHGRRVEHDDFNFVGYQFTLPLMGGVNEKPEAEMRADLRELAPLLGDHTILVTHGPAHGILDRGILDRHAGSLALGELTSRCAFRAHIHGHIHREFGRDGRHFNVASGGLKRAMIIDVGTMEYEVLEV